MNPPSPCPENHTDFNPTERYIRYATLHKNKAVSDVFADLRDQGASEEEAHFAIVSARMLNRELPQLSTGMSIFSYIPPVACLFLIAYFLGACIREPSLTNIAVCASLSMSLYSWSMYEILADKLAKLE